MVYINIHNITKVSIEQYRQSETGSFVMKLTFRDKQNSRAEIIIFSEKELKLEDKK